MFCSDELWAMYKSGRERYLTKFVQRIKARKAGYRVLFSDAVEKAKSRLIDINDGTASDNDPMPTATNEPTYEIPISILGERKQIQPTKPATMVADSKDGSNNGVSDIDNRSDTKKRALTEAADVRPRKSIRTSSAEQVVSKNDPRAGFSIEEGKAKNLTSGTYYEVLESEKPHPVPWLRSASHGHY